jgi:hypothetical protein
VSLLNFRKRDTVVQPETLPTDGLSCALEQQFLEFGLNSLSNEGADPSRFSPEPSYHFLVASWVDSGGSADPSGYESTLGINDWLPHRWLQTVNPMLGRLQRKYPRQLRRPKPTFVPSETLWPLAGKGTLKCDTDRPSRSLDHNVLVFKQHVQALASCVLQPMFASIHD